jgi:acetyltransferase-like isoleucine patch superfamily enzyme
MSQVLKFIRKCRVSESPLLSTLLRAFYYRLRGKNLIVNNRVIIKGLENITTGGLVSVGMQELGLVHKYDRTLINVEGEGKLEFTSTCSIARGCRIVVGTKAVARFGKGVTGADVSFIIMNGLEVGDGFLIAWGTKVMDDDFHEIAFPGKKDKVDKRIIIGNHVWVGTNVLLLSGSRIPNGCVVAAGSVVTKAFEQENCLIGGNPAKVLKENVTWDQFKPAR